MTRVERLDPSPPQPEVLDREIVPGIWLRRERSAERFRRQEREGTYMEIKLPEAEMTEIVEQCEREFTGYVTD